MKRKHLYQGKMIARTHLSKKAGLSKEKGGGKPSAIRGR